MTTDRKRRPDDENVPVTPATAQLVLGLWDALDAYDRLCGEHEATVAGGGPCGCILCEEADGLYYLLDLVAQRFEMNLPYTPERRLALDWLRRHGRRPPRYHGPLPEAAPADTPAVAAAKEGGAA